MPRLSVEAVEVSNVLWVQSWIDYENNSVSGTDAVFLLKVDNISNHQAEVNIEPNGNLVNVPYGENILFSESRNGWFRWIWL
jgi:hypothetical protein